jgi:hypothetical protein
MSWWDGLVAGILLSVGIRELGDYVRAKRGKPSGNMHEAIEAAAPHMLAEGWGEGYGAGWNDCLIDLENRDASTTANPYRPTDAV